MELPGIFNECKGHEGAVSGIDRLFHASGKLYATNGAIVVRGDFPGPPPEPHNYVGKNAPDMGWPTPEQRETLPFVPLPFVGPGMVTCDECNGDAGKHGGYCDWCDNDGIVGDFTPVAVGNLLFATKYIAILRKYDVQAIQVVDCTEAFRRHGRKNVRPPMTLVAYFAGEGLRGF